MKRYYQFPSVPESKIIAFAEGDIVRVFFNIEEAELPVTENDEVESNNPVIYACEQVDVKGGRTYGEIVAAIVNEKYSADDVQAIIANYAELNNAQPLSEISKEKQEEYLIEYNEFQTWRSTAKKVAEQVLIQIS